MNLELAILEVLESAHPRLLKRTTVYAEVSLGADGVTATAFDRAIAQLDAKRQIWIDSGEDVTRIKITPEGLARTAEAR